MAPPDVPLLLRRAQERETGKQFSAAEALYKKILTSLPDQVEALNGLGRLLLRRNQETGGLRLLRRAIDLSGTTPRDVAIGHYNLGNALRRLNKQVAAITSYRTSIQLDQAFVEAHNNLGNALQVVGDSHAARSHFEIALRLRPHMAEAHHGLGNTLRKLGHDAAAADHYRAALTHNPHLSEAAYALADLLRASGRFREAVRHLHKAMKLATGAAPAYVNLGNVFVAAGRVRWAFACYDKAIALKPDDPAAYYNRGLLLQSLEREEEAAAAYHHALAIDPGYADAYNNLGNALNILGLGDRAMEAYLKAVAIEPRPRFYCNLASIRTFTRNDPYLRAMARFDDPAAALSPDDEVALQFALAKAFDDVGNHARAFPYLAKGNALKRQTVAYDEGDTLRLLDRIPAMFGQPANTVPPRNSEADPVLIVGMPRAGTTLVEQILASHPQVHALGEAEFLPEMAGLTQAAIDSPATMSAVLGLLEAGASVSLDALADRYVAAQSAAAKRVVDKQPFNFLYLGWIRRALPRAKIIHVRRDPADTCFSCFSRLFGTSVLFSYDLKELASYYNAYARLMDYWLGLLPPGDVLDLAYEDLVGDLNGQVRRLLAHCDLPWDTACLAFHRTNRPVRTASRGQVRQPVYASSIGRWRHYRDDLQPLLNGLAGRNTSRT